jgi:hypothetical protein
MDMPDPPVVAELCSIEVGQNTLIVLSLHNLASCPGRFSQISCLAASTVLAGTAFRGGGGGAKGRGGFGGNIRCFFRPAFGRAPP